MARSLLSFFFLLLLLNGCTKDVGMPANDTPTPAPDPYAYLDSACGTYNGTQITIAHPASSPADSDTISVQVILTRQPWQNTIILSGLPNPWCGFFINHPVHSDSICYRDSSYFNAFVNQNLEWFNTSGTSVSKKTSYYNEFLSTDTLTTSSTSVYYVRTLHVFR